MKNLKTLFIALLLVAVAPVNAQSVDEIIDNYFENTGGADAWGKLEAIKFTGTANAQGMTIPIEMIQTKDGKQRLKIDIQGQEIVQFAFDGETMWTTNFMTMQAEKNDTETTENMKMSSAKSFPSAFHNYKEKGYTAELLGTETMEGTETFKVKLTMDPVMIDGVETPSIVTYYFDTESFVPIATETEVTQGPMKGQMVKDTQSEYEEVDGLYFPFSISMDGQPITITGIELNPELDDTLFAFPEGE